MFAPLLRADPSILLAHSAYAADAKGIRMLDGSVRGFCCSSWDFIVTMKRIGAEAAIVSALAFTAIGVGAGVASADQPLPSTPGMTWKLDRGGHGHGWDWDDNDDWNGGWGGGPAWYGPPAAPCGAGYWVPPAVWQWVPPVAWGC
jgi:hypothetical protein